MVVWLGRFGLQGFGLLQVAGVKPLGEPAINIRQELAGLVPLTLLVSHPTQAHGRRPLQRFCVLAAGEGDMPTTFRPMYVSGPVALLMLRASQVILLRSPR
jgi:hypothetical protein